MTSVILTRNRCAWEDLPPALARRHPPLATRHSASHLLLNHLPPTTEPLPRKTAFLYRVENESGPCFQRLRLISTRNVYRVETPPFSGFIFRPAPFFCHRMIPVPVPLPITCSSASATCDLRPHPYPRTPTTCLQGKVLSLLSTTQDPPPVVRSRRGRTEVRS
jgi:hypothetical protein